jgi:hypothetical protein
VISITLATGMNRTTIMATSTFVLFRSPKPDAPKLTTDNYDPEMRAYRDGQVRHGADGTAWDQAAERLANCAKAINEARSVGPTDRVATRWRYVRANIEGEDPTFKAAAESFRSELKEKLEFEHQAELDHEWADDLQRFPGRLEAVASKLRADLAVLRPRWEWECGRKGEPHEEVLKRLEAEADAVYRNRGDALLTVAGVGAAEVGVHGTVKAEILSITAPLTLPAELYVRCRHQRCGVEATTDVYATELLENGTQGVRAQLRHIGLRTLRDEGCKCDAPDMYLEERHLQNYSILTLGDPPSLTPGAGFDDTRLTAHLVGPKPPTSGGAVFSVEPFVNLQTRKVEFVGTAAVGSDVRPVPPKLTMELRERFAQEIAALPRSELCRQIAPDVVGRELAQEAQLHVLVSIGKIPDCMGKPIRGSIYVVFLGDTTTGKTEIAKDTAQEQGLGPYVQAENARRTGILFAIEKGSSGSFTLIWGALPRANGGFVVVDGLEAWPSEAQADVRSALRDQEVRVDRVVHGRRPVVVRVCITANPEQDVADYAYKCEAIRDTLPFRKAPDVARIDLWVLFAQADVRKETIAQRARVTRPVDIELFRQYLGWAWSRTADDVVYLPNAKLRIQDLSQVFMETLGSAALPLVSDGFRDTLCRVAVSEAVLAVSTTTGDDVVVGVEHVDAAAKFLFRMYDAAELPAWLAHHETDIAVTGGEAILITRAIGELGDRIIDRLSRGPANSRELAAALNVSSDQIQRAYGVLGPTGVKLIDTKVHVGAELTPRGVAYFRWLRDLSFGKGGSPSETITVAKLRDRLGIVSENRDSSASGVPEANPPPSTVPKATTIRPLDGDVPFGTSAPLSPESATSPPIVARNRDNEGVAEGAVHAAISEPSADEKTSVQVPPAVDSKALPKDPREAAS